MNTMLDKTVIKHTRSGIQQENLATGERRMLTLSQYGRELRYDKSEQAQYVTERNNSTSDLKVMYRRGTFQSGQGTYRVKRGLNPNSAVPEVSASAEKSLTGEFIYQRGHSQTINDSMQQSEREYSGSANSVESHQFALTRVTGLQKVSGTPKTKYYSPDFNDRVLSSGTSPTLLPDGLDSHGYRHSKHVISSAILRVGETSAEDLEENDNLGLAATGTYADIALRSIRGFRNIKNLRERRHVSRNTRIERHIGRKAAKVRVARNTVQKNVVPSAVQSVQKVGQAVIKTLANPATWKAVAIVGGIILLIFFVSEVSSAALSSTVGSTTEHPELSDYVMQLDSEFQQKVADVQSSYAARPDTTVTVQGSNVINTDENALAILATGDWTDIQLTDSNKGQLARLHRILNTYTVSQKDKTVSTIASDGTVTTKTTHEVTIIISTYTAREKIDAFGFDAEKKSHVLEMLELLDELSGINDENPSPIIGSPGGSPGESYDDPQVQALMTEAEKYLGYPYVWGGSTPETSFDCSGFVSWVYTHSGVHNLPRTTAQGIYDQCQVVSPSDAEPGDLIFFQGTYPTSSTVTHVGIYVGNGRMLHCGNPIQFTSLNKEYWQQHFYAYGRLR